MDKKEAIKILIQAAQVAQKAGAFDLGSAKLVAFAVEALQENPKEEGVKVEVEKKDKK